MHNLFDSLQKFDLGNGKQGSLLRADAGRAQPDILDDPGAITETTGVAHAKYFIGHSSKPERCIYRASDDRSNGAAK